MDSTRGNRGLRLWAGNTRVIPLLSQVQPDLRPDARGGLEDPAPHLLGVASHFVHARPWRLDAFVSHKSGKQVPQQVDAGLRTKAQTAEYAAVGDGGGNRQPHIS